MRRLRWRRTLRALREECPTLLPVRVRRTGALTDYFAVTDLARDGLRFNVTLHERIDSPTEGVRAVTELEMYDSLIHEWAHCLSWNPSHSLEDHDAQWGVAYARCYNAVEAD